jgi:hypothetical protein
MCYDVIFSRLVIMTQEIAIGSSLPNFTHFPNVNTKFVQNLN